MRLLLGCVRRWYTLSLRSEAAAAPSSRLAAKRALPSTPILVIHAYHRRREATPPVPTRLTHTDTVVHIVPFSLVASGGWWVGRKIVDMTEWMAETRIVVGLATIMIRARSSRNPRCDLLLRALRAYEGVTVGG